MNHNHYYQTLLELCQKLAGNAASVQNVYATDTGNDEFPASQLVMRRAGFPYQDAEIEINLTAPEVRPPYHWLAEITFRLAPVEHYLLTDEGNIEEAYGKKITLVDDARTERLLSILESLSANT